MNVDEILSGIRSRVGTENLSNTCRKDGCRVSMEDVPTPRIVVDADRAFPAHNVEGKRCDYVLFFIGTAADTLVIVPMELKGGTVDASVTSEQLQCGGEVRRSYDARPFRRQTHLPPDTVPWKSHS